MKMKKVMYISLIYILILNANSIKLPEIDELTEILNICTEKIINEQMQSSMLHVKYQSYSSYIIDSVLENIQPRLLTSTINTYESRTKDYVIFSDNIPGLILQINKMYNMSDWNPRARFLLVKTSNSNEISRIFSLFQNMWKLLVINVLFMIPDSTTGNILLFRMHPFHETSSCGKRMGIRQIGICQNGNITGEMNLFLSQKYNVNKCNFKVFALKREPYVSDITSKEYPGISVSFLKLINEIGKLNISIVTASQQYARELLSFGTLNYLKKDLKGMQMLGVIGPLSMNKDFDVPMYLFEDATVWVVPSAGKMPQWIGLVIVFKKFVWVAVVLTIALVTMVWWIIARIIIDHKQYASPMICFLALLALKVGQGLHITPKTRIIKGVLLVWIIYAMHVYYAYQAKLSSMLTSPFYEKQISSVEELLLSNLLISFQPVYLDLFEEQRENGDEISDKILKAFSTSLTANVTMDLTRAYFRQDIGTIGNLATVNFLKTKFVGSRDLYVFDKRINTYYTVMLLQKGHFLLNRINEVILRLHAAGYSTKLLRELKDRGAKVTDDESSEDESNVAILTVNHLQGAFYILAIGLVLAFLILCAELVYFFHKTNK